MNIWQKRVLIFFLKFFGVILVIAVITLFLYYNLYFKKDSLLKYAPKNSVAYMALRVNNGLLNNQSINNLANSLKTDFDLDFNMNILNPLVGYNAAIAVIPNDKEFDYLLILNLKPGLKYINELEEVLNKYNLYYDHLTHDVIEKNILVISNSELVINEVKKINVQEASSLADRVNVVLSLKSIPISNQGKAFIDIKKLKDWNIGKNSNLSLSLANISINEIYLNIKDTNDNLVFKSFNYDINKNSLILSELLPKQYLFSLSLNKANLNIEEFLEKLNKIDNSYGTLAKNYINYYQQLYKFDLQSDILQLFEENVQIIASNEKKWLIIADLSSFNDYKTKINKVEQIIKEHLAYNNPIIIEKQLPDYTYIKQIVKQTDNYDFVINDIRGIDLYKINKNGDEYAYFILDNVIYLANNRQLLANLLNERNYISISENSRCYGDLPNFSQKLMINAENLENFWPINSYLSKILYTQNSTNDEIWLCLE